MKRIISYCAIAAAVLPILAACGKDNGEDRTADYGELSFSATVPSVEGTGIKLDWSAGESISIFDGKANHEFKASESGSETVFTGTADKKAARYMGLSPYNGSLQRYSGKVSVSIPASQEAVAGGMDSDARFMAAYADPDAGTLEFKLLPALLRFSIDGTGYNIVSVQVTAKGGEAIAGDCKIGLFETPVIEAASGSSSKVQMNGSNIGGTYCLAVIPQNLTSGVCVSISDENDARCEIEIPAFEMKSGEVSDLGKFEKLDLKEAVNPNPTSVSGAVIMKASFKESDFNVLSDGSFDDFPSEGIGSRTSWKGLHPAISRISGHTGSYAWRLDNPTPGVWFEMYTQCIGFRTNTDYVYSMYGMAATPHAYNGVRLFPANLGLERGGVGPNSWSDFEEDTQWTYVEMPFSTGSNFYGDVFCGLWGDAGAFVSIDDVKVVPKGYDKKSVATVSAGQIASVRNSTFDEVSSYGQAVAWICSDGKIAIGFSNAVINGVTYKTAVAYTDNTSFSEDLTIVKFIKKKGKISPIVNPSDGETSIVPDAVINTGGKLYMHYFAKSQENGPDSWTASRAAFAVSEDDGKTWKEAGDGAWSGTGKFAQAGFVRNGGYTYMVGSAAGRTNDYYANFFGARVADGKDFTDPSAYEYWTGEKWEDVEESLISGSALLSVGDISEPALIYNARFDRYMLIYRSNKHRGIVYRDADSPEGFWSGEKILTDDNVDGTLSAPVVLDIDADGNIIFLATKVQ